TYLKLAKLYASKGFMAEAKQNFVEYAERMHKAGKIQHAFAALKEFADISAEGAHLRQTLEDHLRMYGDPERRPGGGAAAPAAPAAPKPQPPDDPSKSGRRKTSSLVFLDVDAPPAGKPPLTGRVPPPPKLPPKPALEPEPVVESLIEPVIAEHDTSLEIETTSLVDGLEPSTAGGMLEGFETTGAEFGEIQLDAQPAPALQDEVSPDDIHPRRSSSQPWPRRRAPPMPRSRSSGSAKRRSGSRRRWRRRRGWGRGAGRRRPPLRGDRPEPGRRRDAGGRTRIARVRQHRCAPGETDHRGPRGAGRR